MASPAHQFHQLKGASTSGMAPEMTSAEVPKLALIRQLTGPATNRKRRIVVVLSSPRGNSAQRLARLAPAKAWRTAPMATHKGANQAQPSSPERVTASMLVSRAPMNTAGQMRRP